MTFKFGGTNLNELISNLKQAEAGASVGLVVGLVRSEFESWSTMY